MANDIQPHGIGDLGPDDVALTTEFADFLLADEALSSFVGGRILTSGLLGVDLPAILVTGESADDSKVVLQFDGWTAGPDQKQQAASLRELMIGRIEQFPARVIRKDLLGVSGWGVGPTRRRVSITAVLTRGQNA
jgi:hypothetical protein